MIKHFVSGRGILLLRNRNSGGGLHWDWTEGITGRSFRVFRMRMIRAESAMSRRSVFHCRRRRRTTAGFSTSCRISSLQCRMMTHIWRVLILMAIGPLQWTGLLYLQIRWPNSWSVWNPVFFWAHMSLGSDNLKPTGTMPTGGPTGRTCLSSVSRQTTSAVSSKRL